MSIAATRDRLERSVIDLLWRQWIQLGVSGDEGPLDRWAIDPEALLAITLRVGGRDPRLFDEVLDWLAVNGRTVSVQRLANLTKDDDASRILADATLAWAGSHNPTLRGWRRRHGARPASPIVPGSIRVGRPDPILAEFGVRWPKVEPSGKSHAPDMSLPAAFAFKLRALFGVGTRSEIIRFFLTAREGNVTAQRVAEVSGFAKRNVHETLAALSEAGPLQMAHRGNELLYSLHPSGWAEVLDVNHDDLHLMFPEFLDWTALARVLVRSIVWLDSSIELSPYLQASGARELVLQLEPQLSRLGVAPPSRRTARGEAYWPVFESTVDRLILKLEPPTQR